MSPSVYDPYWVLAYLVKTKEGASKIILDTWSNVKEVGIIKTGLLR